MADDAKKLDAAESLAVAAAEITDLASTRGGAHNLSPLLPPSSSTGRRNTIVQRCWDGHRNLAGKVALVTGAASGLGCGIAQGLVEAGAAVAFCDVDDAGAKEAAAAQPLRSARLPYTWSDRRRVRRHGV